MKKEFKQAKRMLFLKKQKLATTIYYLSFAACLLITVLYSVKLFDQSIQEVSSKTKKINLKPKIQAISPKIESSITSNNKVQHICKDIKVKKGDTLAKIFLKDKISYLELEKILISGKENKVLNKIAPGQNITLCKNKEDLFASLEYKINPKKTLKVNSFENGNYNSELIQHEFETKLTYKSIELKNYFYLDAKRAGVSDQMIMNLSYIFAWDIDFNLDLRVKDKIYLLYEEEFLDGEKIGNGSIIAAEFINSGKSYTAVRYIDPTGKESFYTKEGLSLKKAFIRNPVKFTRISSHFNLKRKHPILHKIRAHRGVDLAAPKGTPIKASGDGKIIFKGVKSGYGNTIVIQHGHKYSTLYAHLSRFNNKLKVGSKVKQGDLIAYVGMTGLATAPHLHYEFRINGVHKDPLKVKLPKAKPIDKANREDFLLNTKELFEIMNKHKQLTKNNVKLSNE